MTSGDCAAEERGPAIGKPFGALKSNHCADPACGWKVMQPFRVAEDGLGLAIPTSHSPSCWATLSKAPEKQPTNAAVLSQTIHLFISQIEVWQRQRSSYLRRLPQLLGYRASKSTQWNGCTVHYCVFGAIKRKTDGFVRCNILFIFNCTGWRGSKLVRRVDLHLHQRNNTNRL